MPPKISVHSLYNMSQLPIGNAITIEGTLTNKGKIPCIQSSDDKLCIDLVDSGLYDKLYLLLNGYTLVGGEVQFYYPVVATGKLDIDTINNKPILAEIQALTVDVKRKIITISHSDILNPSSSIRVRALQDND